LAIACLLTLEVAAQSKQAKGRQMPKTAEATLKSEATRVAHNYWSKRFTRCGDIAVWAVRRPPVGGVRTTTQEDLVFFASKDVPVIVIEDDQPLTDKKKDRDSQRLEWSGSSRISTKTAQDIYLAISSAESSWNQNVHYAVTIQKADGVWKAVEDQRNEKLVPQPLFEEIMTGPPALLASCLRFGGNPNLRNDSGDTLLMTAASAGNEYAVEELLDKHADVNLKNRNGWTASYLARLQKHKGVAEMLDSAHGVCEGPIKNVCERFPVAPVDSTLLTPDPLLTAPESPKPKKPDNSSTVRFFNIPKAEYTAEARRNNISGTVVLSVVLLASGEVGQIRVVSGLPYGLTEQAIEAAKKIKFKPAMVDGRAVDKEKKVEFNFALP
jgi:TonB family protein